MIDLGYERIIVFEDDIRFSISSATITDKMTDFRNMHAYCLENMRDLHTGTSLTTFLPNNTVLAEEKLLIRFEPEFLENMDSLYEELDRLKLDWDLVYLGRKILENVHEPFVEGSEFILRPDYTYWTLSYLLSR